MLLCEPKIRNKYLVSCILSSALSSAGYFKSHCCKQCGSRSDCSSRNLIWVHPVCQNTKSMFEKFASRCGRRHKQTTFSDAGFLGVLRVKSLRLAIWVKFSAGDIVKYVFLISPKKQDLTFHANSLHWKQFARNI